MPEPMIYAEYLGRRRLPVLDARYQVLVEGLFPLAEGFVVWGAIHNSTSHLEGELKRIVFLRPRKIRLAGLVGQSERTQTLRGAKIFGGAITVGGLRKSATLPGADRRDQTQNISLSLLNPESVSRQ